MMVVLIPIYQAEICEYWYSPEADSTRAKSEISSSKCSRFPRWPAWDLDRYGLCYRRLGWGRYILLFEFVFPVAVSHRLVDDLSSSLGLMCALDPRVSSLV